MIKAMADMKPARWRTVSTELNCLQFVLHHQGSSSWCIVVYKLQDLLMELFQGQVSTVQGLQVTQITRKSGIGWNNQR
ncbi:hypothetical protein QTP86_020971 [Hemibagrus guttatus]|nr:hypothetical protein QTP86_020971 [Hemibagrus guttatus]